LGSLTGARLEELLRGRYVATLATLEPDGAAYLNAVWFLWDGEAVLVATGGMTQKVRNARARPRASVIVDARGRGALRGAAATASVAVVTGAEALELNERVWAKYLTPRGLDDPRVGG